MPVCSYCGTVHDGKSPKCAKCGRKVEMVDTTVDSLDTETVEAAKRSKLFALLAYLGLFFLPLGLIFGIKAIKSANKVKSGMYLKDATQGRYIAWLAIVLSVVMLVIYIYLYGTQIFDAVEKVVMFIINGPSV